MKFLLPVVISLLLPLTHANIAMRTVLIEARPLWHTWPQLAALGGFFVVLLAGVMALGHRHARILSQG